MLPGHVSLTFRRQTSQYHLDDCNLWKIDMLNQIHKTKTHIKFGVSNGDSD